MGLMIFRGPDPYLGLVGNQPSATWPSLGTHKEEGHYAIAVGEGSIRVLGRWWIAAAQRGEVEAHGKFMNLCGGSFGFQPFVVDVGDFLQECLFVVCFFCLFWDISGGYFLQLVLLYVLFLCSVYVCRFNLFVGPLVLACLLMNFMSWWQSGGKLTTFF